MHVKGFLVLCFYIDFVLVIFLLFISGLLLTDIEIHKKFLFFSEQNEPKELIPLIGTSSSPCLVGYQSSNQIASQHKRKLRSLALCPVNDKHFATR